MWPALLWRQNDKCICVAGWYDLDSDFLSENLFCIDNNDVIDDDNNVYIISIFNCLYFYLFSDSQFCFDDGRGGGKEVWMVVVAF